MQNIFIDVLPPWVETGLQPAFYDLESGTVLQQTARMYAKVKELTLAFNTFSENVTNEVKRFEDETNDEIERFEGVVNGVVEEYIEKFNDLHDYVHDYFDNLDVQEEINHKLDKMAEDGTLEEIIARYISPNVNIIFCKQKGEVQSGDATLIKVYDKNVLIDTHLDTLKSEIEDFLDRNNAKHLDYVILSHYHADHVGNVKNLCDDGYIDSDTTVYMPGYTHLISESTPLTVLYQEVNNALTGVGATKINPTEATTLEIEDALFKFYNCTEAIFDAEGYTAYNDCSTVVELDYGVRKALFTADIEVKPFDRFERLNYFPYKIDLYTVEHHGINYQGRVLPFISRITPNYAVQSAELGDFVGGAIGQGATTIFLKDKNCKLYSTYNNSQDIIFEMNKKKILCKQGIENYSTSNRRPEIPIYVDINTDSSNRDGSESQPFKDLQEALSRIPQNEHTAYHIYLADGIYEANSNSAVLGKISGSTQITIDGNHDHPENTIIANSCQIYNGAYVKYQYVKFTKQIASVVNSVIEVNNCIGVRSESNSEAYIYGGGNSNIRVINSTFTGNGTGQMISGHGDDIYCYNNTFNTFNICIQNQYSGSTISLNNTFNSVTNPKYLFNGAVDLSKPIIAGDLLFQGEVTDLNTDIDLAQPLNRYNMLIVTLGYNGETPNQATVLITYQDIANFYKNSNLMGSYNYSLSGNATPGLVRFAIGNDLNKIQVTKQDAIHVRKIVGAKITI